MKNYKICVYTIAKNEEDNVNKWVNSMNEADYICVLDTGSTDDTVYKLKQRGVIVEQKIIDPWRFDVARNESMKLIPESADICVSTDLDEVFEKGWAKKLRTQWKDEYLMGRYWYIFQHTQSGGAADAFYRDKIHKNDPMFYWQFPIHEVLWRPESIKEVLFPNITLHHWQNMNTPRKCYLELMELEYFENPTNTRNLFLLGREYYIYKDWKNAIIKLEEFVKIGPRKIVYEKAFGLNLIGYSYLSLNDINNALFAFTRSLNIFKEFRMTYLGLAACYIILQEYDRAIYYINESLKIKKRFTLFSDEGAAWEDKPYKMLAQCYAAQKKYKEILPLLDEIIKYDINNTEGIKKEKEKLELFISQNESNLN